MRNVSEKCCREDKHTHFVFNNFLFFENGAVLRMYKSAVQPDRPLMTVSMSACALHAG